MPSGVTVKFDDQLRQFFSRAELLAEAISRGLEEGAKEGETLVKLNTPVRSGRLQQSFGYRMDKDGLGFRLGSIQRAEGKAVRYAAIQDVGGTIVPRRKKYLAWPLDSHPGVTKAGVAGFSAGDRAVYKQYGIGKTFAVPSKRGGGRLVVLETLKPPKYRTVEGKRVLVEKGEYRPLFVLAPSVTLKGSRYFSAIVDSPGFRNTIVAEVDRAIRQMLAVVAVGNALSGLGAPRGE
mgnify:CR=1 FL=1